MSNRWDISALDQLPEYMRLCYRALLDVYSEMEKEMAEKGKTYCVNYAKEAVSTFTLSSYYVICKKKTYF